MEIGSFLELSFPRGKEWYQGDSVARLNSGRAAIWHAVRCLGCDEVWVPYYQCDTVRNFLLANGIKVRYYEIDRDFTPLCEKNEASTAFLLVNYYGVMGSGRMRELASRYQNVIIDNSQAFFAPPIKTCLNVYSARKFVGVPDGAYVVGEGSEQFLETYPQDYSSDTADFLLKRIEYGCEGATYAARMKNEARIDSAPCMRMSKLTHAILDGADYPSIAAKRRENFAIAHALLGEINLLSPMQYYESETIPMVYPFLAEKDELLAVLLKHKHFQGHWWSYLLDEVSEDSAARWFSRYMIPITIDQRYGQEEIAFVADIIKECLSK